ncbi:hypothetical protein MTQ01_11720 [Streptomyces sp. XM4193]|uniref:DUF7848 domain-containing protein n=1 Tax=Streptomyces sp. XM4193 TaxID=2929782 RepID=UPI001FF84981|nr:hypothetical protein [Streptomyces sp. XM4193]MCK1796671.1 hypothetical protein [Streptomyces sp. XM4193]
MSGQRRRYRSFTVTADLEPDAEPITFAMACCVCGATGPESTDPDLSSAWVPTHLKHRPEHLSYRETVTRPYRAIPGPWL